MGCMDQDLFLTYLFMFMFFVLFYWRCGRPNLSYSHQTHFYSITAVQTLKLTSEMDSTSRITYSHPVKVPLYPSWIRRYSKRALQLWQTHTQPGVTALWKTQKHTLQNLKHIPITAHPQQQNHTPTLSPQPEYSNTDTGGSAACQI